MAARDYEYAPLSESLGIGRIISGLASDLDELRAGKISVNDAVARSLLAKQIFNGVRIYLNGTKLLAGHALPITDALSLGSADAARSEDAVSNGMPPTSSTGEAG